MLTTLGRTGERMLFAPDGAVYVWHDDCLHYPKELAWLINRVDLVIKPFSWLYGPMTGVNWRDIILDHAAEDRFNRIN
jgi:hypothetical protein